MTIQRLAVQAHSLWFLGLAVACAPALSQAAVFTVGVGGSHATLTTAWNAAVAAAGSSHEIRVRAGTYAERPNLGLNTAKTLTVSGGWNAGFTSASNDPAVTTFDAGGLGRGLGLNASNGTMLISGLRVINGLAEINAGVDLSASLTGNITLSNFIVENNRCETQFSASAGGIGAQAIGDSHILVRRGTVRNNQAISTVASGMSSSQSASAAGVAITADGNATAELSDTLITGNMAHVVNHQVLHVGLRAAAFASGNVSILRNRVIGNVGADLGSTGLAGVNSGYGAGFSAGTFATGTSDAQLEVRSNVFRNNAYMGVAGVSAGLGTHVELAVASAGLLRFSDNEVSGGTGGFRGVDAIMLGSSSTLRLTNLTVADHSGNCSGLFVQGQPPATASLYNSLISGHAVATSVPAWVTSGSNMVDSANPGYQNAAARDYHLSPGSPARDAGTNAPAGGLGSTDADGLFRLLFGTVDIGAYEYGNINLFASGFE